MEQFHTEPVEAPRKKRRWPAVLLVCALVLGISTVLHLLNFPAIRVEKTDGGFIVFVGSAAKAAEEKTHFSAAPFGSPLPGGKDIPFAENNLILQEFLQTVMPGAEVEEVPLKARIYFDLPEGLHVRAVHPSSAAARNGLCPGDIVTGLDGMRTITVFRNGHTYDLVIIPG